jgi:dUTP pyrophosphatase
MSEEFKENSIEDLNKILDEITTMVNEYGSGADIDDGVHNLTNVVEHYKNLHESGEFKTITKFINRSNNPDPTYSHMGDSGFDIRASLKESITLGSLERKLIPTGLSFELSPNTELQIRPRSGMSLKHGITVLNTPGTVDEGYRGDVGIIVINLSKEKYTIEDGDRIAQGIIMNVVNERTSHLVNSENLSNSSRGSDGFGSTGKK